MLHPNPHLQKTKTNPAENITVELSFYCISVQKQKTSAEGYKDHKHHNNQIMKEHNNQELTQWQIGP